MYFSDPDGNKVDAAHYGIEHEAIADARDVNWLLRILETARRNSTFIGNEAMEHAKNSGQLEGWNQILEKFAAVLAELAHTK